MRRILFFCAVFVILNPKILLADGSIINLIVNLPEFISDIQRPQPLELDNTWVLGIGASAGSSTSGRGYHFNRSDEFRCLHKCESSSPSSGSDF